MSSLARHLVFATVGVALCAPTLAEAAKRKTTRAHHAPRIARPATPATAATTPPLVKFGSIVIGTDPDPRIRRELLRDLGAVFGGAD